MPIKANQDRRHRIPKQRHTAKRIHERLRAEHGFAGGYTIVKDCVRERRARVREVFVPLAHPPGHAQADTIIAAAWARVDPGSRDDGAEDGAPTDWRRMAWPVRNRDGTCADLLGPDEWEREHERRVAAIQARQGLTADARRAVLRAVRDGNRELLAELRERGHGAAVESVEALFADALGGGMALAAAAE